MKPRKFLGNSIDLKTGGGYLAEQALIFSCRDHLAVVERIDMTANAAKRHMRRRSQVVLLGEPPRL